MKLLFLFLVTVASLAAQTGAQLSGEEMRLIELFRLNPGPYRALMYGVQAVPEDSQPGKKSLGATDIVEVSFVGGKLSFVGRNGKNKNLAIRIVRGGTAVTALAREDDSAAVAVTISFGESGLRVSWPDSPATEGKGLAAGSFVIPESNAWTKGDVINWTGPIDKTSRASEQLKLRVRYYTR